jgi:hypothetical protein
MRDPTDTEPTLVKLRSEAKEDAVMPELGVANVESDWSDGNVEDRANLSEEKGEPEIR